MTGTDPGTAGDGRPAPWLLRQKIAVPDRVAGYFDRAGLVDRAMPTRRRLTVLVAPGGFGKTTLLAECCRRAREDGIPVAWVSVDEQDEPAVLDTYIACACRSAAGALADVDALGVSVMGQLKFPPSQTFCPSFLENINNNPHTLTIRVKGVKGLKGYIPLIEK